MTDTAAEQAADCCCVVAGVLAVLIHQRGEGAMQPVMAAIRRQLRTRRRIELLDLWDRMELMAVQMADGLADMPGATARLQ